MSFGNILKKLRQDKNLTQEELAKKINSSRSNIANYENNKNMPSVDILDKLSEIFNVSIDYLLGKTDIKNIVPENDNIWDAFDIFIDNYTPPTETQKEQIKGMLEIILKENKKDIQNEEE